MKLSAGQANQLSHSEKVIMQDGNSLIPYLKSGGTIEIILNDEKNSISRYNYISEFKSIISDSAKRVDMIVKISQSGPENFNIDRFATINRCNIKVIIDNLGNYRPMNSSSVNLNNGENDLS